MAARSIAIKDIEFKRNLSIYFSFMKKYKLLMIVAIIIIFIVESLHLVEKFLFKLIIDRGTEFNSNVISQQEFINTLFQIGTFFITTTLVLIIFYWFRPHLMNRLNARVITDMKRKYFNHILNLDHNFHTTHKTGSMISKLAKGAGSIERMTDIIAFNLIPLIIQLLIISLAIIYFDITSVIIILSITALMIIFSFTIQRLQEDSSIVANETEHNEKGSMSDFFTNIDSIKYYGKEKIINKKFEDLIDKTKYAFLRNWDYFRIMRVGQSIILGLGTFILIYTVMQKFIAGLVTLGTVALIYTAYSTLLLYMFAFVSGLRNFYRSMADFQELFNYDKFTNEIKDKPDAKNISIEKGTIEFRNVNFNYGPRSIFHNFNLKINENEKIALVGHSGSGKTTLIKLLNRFYDVDSGKILIDGQDIKDYKQESIRGETGIVPQECILFDDTLYNNIKFADSQATKEEVHKAIKFAQLDKILEHFPEKEKTRVGERGVKLSGGEKQRVSIARAILANKRILVLDEATSALDSETESEIQRELSELLKGRTSIIIAHRLSTIMNADRIIVMKHGKIVQEGTHSQLINQQGEYKKLWNLQKGGYIK